MRSILLILSLLILIGGHLSPARAAAGTFLLKPRDLRLTNIRILAERVHSASETEIEFTTDVQNTDSGKYSDISIYIVRSNAVPTMKIPDAGMTFASLPEFGTAVGGTGNSFIVVVPNEDVGAARVQILNGQLLEVTANEEIIYGAPVAFVDKATDSAFTSVLSQLGLTVLVFSNSTPILNELTKGYLLLADPAPGAYRPIVPGESGFAVPHLAQHIPFEVDSVLEVEGKVHVIGKKRDLLQIVKSGTFIADTKNAYKSLLDPYNPTVENTYTEVEQKERDLLAAEVRLEDPYDGRLADLLGLKAIPVRFNELLISDHLRLSGEILLRSSGLQFEVAFRDFALKKATARIDAGLVANMVIETVETRYLKAERTLQKEVELVHLPLPPVPINIAGIPMSMGATFTVRVGAEATAPGGLSIPVQSSMLVGAEIGYDNGQTFAAPIKEFVQPHVSDPTVFQAVEASARAWAEVTFALTFGDGFELLTVGPALTVRAEGSFTARPLANPWWELDLTGELLGEFNLNLFTMKVTGVEKSFHRETFLQKRAQGPLIPQTGSPLARQNVAVKSLRPIAGKDTRWAVAFQPKPGQGSYGEGFVLPLPGGDIFIGNSGAFHSCLGRFTAEGEVVWMQSWASLIKTVDAVQLADGRILLLGMSHPNWFLAYYDGNGKRQSVYSFTSDNMTVTDLAATHNAIGEPEYYISGFINRGGVTQSDPVLIKVNAANELVWSKSFDLAGDDEVSSVDVLKDGNILLVGRTATSALGTVKASPNGLLLKINPQGEILWSRNVESRWGMELKSAAEMADGSLVVAGSNGDLVWDYYPSVLVAKFTPDGELVNHVLLGEDPDETDELPDAGDTPYDTATEIVAGKDGLYITGISNVGARGAAFVASLTEELGVQWWSAFDGPNWDGFQDLAVTDEGLAVMGGSDSVLPFGTGGEHAAVLFKYPWEGMLRVHPDTSAKTAYLHPRIFLSSEHDHFFVLDDSTPGQSKVVRTASVPFVVNNLVITRRGEIPIGSAVTPAYARLEKIDPSLVDGFNEWVAYHQLKGPGASAIADLDGDKRSNNEEFFFGTNPFRKDRSPELSVMADRSETGTTITINVPYAHLDHHTFALYSASDVNGKFGPKSEFSTKILVPAEPGSLGLLQLQTTIDSESRKFFSIGMNSGAQ